MDEALYRNHYEVQGKHWWFVVKKSIVVSMIKRFASTKNGAKVLDVGSGCGLMLSDLKSFGEVSAMDFSDDAISFCKLHFNGTIKKGELPLQVPYTNGSFNVLTALDVVEHIDEDVEALRSIRKLLVKNGTGILTVPAYMFLWSDHDEVNHHKRRYTQTEFREKILKAGFRIEKISYYNTLLFPIVFLIRFMHRLLNIKSGADTDMPGPLVNFILMKIFAVEEVLLKYMNLPFGVSVIAVVSNPEDV